MSLSQSMGGLRPASAGGAVADDIYGKLAVAGGFFFLALEVIYFSVSGRPSFEVPSLDGFGGLIGRDFVTTWMGARAALDGGPAHWFDPDVYNGALRVLVGQPDLFTHYWYYPPHLLLFTWPLGRLPYIPAYLVWCAVGLAAYLLASLTAGVSRRQFLFLAFAPAVALNIFFGQNGFFTAALLIGGLAHMERRPILAGVLFGILTIKPQLGLLLPLMLLVSGQWRVIGSAVATAAVLAATTAWLYGSDIWADYVSKVLVQQQWLHSHGGDPLVYMIGSAFYAWRLLDLPMEWAWPVQAVVSGLAAAAVVWTYWRRRDPTLSMALFVTAAFLATPYVLHYDMVLFAFIVALLRERSDNRVIDHCLALAVWTLPVSMMIFGLGHIPIAMLILPLFAGRLLWRLARETQPAAAVAVPADTGVPAQAAAGGH